MNSLIVVYWCKFTSNHFCSKFTQILRQFESKNRSELVFFNWKATNTFRCQRVKKKENSNKKPTKVRSPQCDFSWLGKTRRCSKVICGGVTLQVLHPASLLLLQHWPRPKQTSVYFSAGSPKRCCSWSFHCVVVEWIQKTLQAFKAKRKKSVHSCVLVGW